MKQPCSECKELPKAPGRHRCEECHLRHRPMLEQIEAAQTRRAKAEQEDSSIKLMARVPARMWPTGRRWCSGCQSFRMVDFGPGRASDFAPNTSRCRPCASQSAHKARIGKVYGIDSNQYEELLFRQGGVCAICQARATTTRLAVDHDHKTGQVRGLLCKRCNHDLLGAAHDSIVILNRAVDYLMFPPASVRF